MRSLGLPPPAPGLDPGCAGIAISEEPIVTDLRAIATRPFQGGASFGYPRSLTALTAAVMLAVVGASAGTGDQ